MKLKKSLAIIIAVVMVITSLISFTNLTSLQEQVSAANVSDIDGHWGKNYIQTLVSENIISGYEDGTFRPDNSITRAEFCTIITKALVKEGMISFVTPGGIFTDVAAGDWYASYVETAAANNFV